MKTRTIHRINRRFVWITSLFLLLHLLSLFNTKLHAQLVGEQAELERLETQATNAMAIGDPHGAALSIGKAAMMSAILAKKDFDRTLKSVYSGTEALFRTQENAYRAIALFEQAGGQAPAPTGACQLLTLAKHHSVTAKKIFSNIDSTEPSKAISIVQQYMPQAQEWLGIVQELQADFACF